MKKLLFGALALCIFSVQSCDWLDDDCVCVDIYAPVCGEDGVTYSNSCEAECAVVAYTEGECITVIDSTWCGTDHRCTMEPDPGICQAAFIRYYFDQEEGKCKEFMWGGCGAYPFETLEECENCGCGE